MIKNFKFSRALINKANRLKAEIPSIITNPEKLYETFLDHDWRQLPSNFDIPSNPQIFGQLINTSGIEAILYPSKFTKKYCLAIYPRNFQDTDSYIELDDEAPHRDIPNRIDSENWRISEMDIEEIIKSN